MKLSALKVAAVCAAIMAATSCNQARKENGLVMSHHPHFATAINCMDGRTQEAVQAYMKGQYGVDYVDMITEPGPVKILAENSDDAAVGSIKRRVDISINKHHSKVIAVTAHPECAGNPVDKDQQLEQLQLAYETVESWRYPAEIILLWVQEDWITVKKIPASALQAQ